MKKRVAVLMLAVVMTVLALAGCGGGKDSSPVVGTWKATEVEAMGVNVKVSEYLEQMGMGDVKMELSVKDDGKFSMDLMGQQAEGTWKYSGSTLTMTVDGSDAKAEYKDGKLTMEESGAKIIFEK
ncbi:MAG: lipocalin family protein [Lachnospiraceae bacterium]|jgi:uncharacterized lipoprotein YehR (DUF1307 family)|nr:lipocalin family protein [Lachnospiraceae bacterium]